MQNKAGNTPKTLSEQVLSLLFSYGLRSLNLRVSKPGDFPLFSGKLQIVLRTLSGLFLVGALNRPRERKRTDRENPRSIPEQIGKSQKNRESPKKDKKGRTSPDRETPRSKPPRLAALDKPGTSKDTVSPDQSQMQRAPLIVGLPLWIPLNLRRPNQQNVSATCLAWAPQQIVSR